MIGGVCLASVKELDFAWSALIAAGIANLFAAFKGNENKKLMETDGLKERIGSVGNQFALTTLISFIVSLPFMYFKEGAKWGEFVTLFNENPIVRVRSTGRCAVERLPPRHPFLAPLPRLSSLLTPVYLPTPRTTARHGRTTCSSRASTSTATTSSPR